MKQLSFFNLDTVLITAMFATLFIPSQVGSVISWTELPLSLFVRAAIWLVGLTLLPGFYALDLSRLSKNLPRIERIVIGANASLVLVSIVNIIFYRFGNDFTLFPHVILALIVILKIANLLGEKKDQGIVKLSRSHILLLLTVVAAVLIAFLVQVRQQYLIPGDLWVASRSGIEVLSRPDVYDTFSYTQYPVVFGFLLAGLSVSLGIPVINTFALLFPLVSLNILSFFLLVKVVFRLDTKTGSLACAIYAFSGGLSWLIQVLVFQNNASMWTLNNVSQDIYFSMPFWNTMEFSHRTLALTLAFMSIVVFVIATRIENKIKNTVALALSSLLMVFSFFIHIIEPFITIITIIALIFFNEVKCRNHYRTLTSFAIITLAIFISTDYLMHNYYLWLTNVKLERLVNSLNTYNIIIVGVLLVAGAYVFRRLTKTYSNRHSYRKKIKHFLIASLLVVYIAGLVFADFSSSMTIASGFPWYLYVTRYGFVGILALIGLTLVDWKESRYRVAFFWGAVAIVAGSIWWGVKLNAYLFPIVSLFAAVAINMLWKKAHNIVHIKMILGKNSVEKCFKFNLKALMTILMAIIVPLSFTSFIYGSAYYISADTSLSHSTVEVLAWINQNTPQNATILVPDVYNIRKGVETISDRKVILGNEFPNTLDAESFANLTDLLQKHNIRYALATETNEYSYLINGVLSYSSLVFQSGQTKVFQLPQLKSPSQPYTVATLAKEHLGLPTTHSFEWADDDFTSGWNYQNVNATSDGEVATFRWDFSTADQKEPSMKKKITQIDTNLCPYLIVKYRNTQETTSTAEDNIGQIITLINSTGYPAGFVQNSFIPISNERQFTIFTAKLPQNRNVAEIWIWMRNYEKLNGTVELEVDYIGISSAEAVLEESEDLEFLSMAVPAYWPINYTIISDMTEAKNASVLITLYDKSAADYVENQSDMDTFIFINTTITFPMWGANWRTDQQGIMSGNFQGKNVLIIGLDVFQLHDLEDLTRLATLVYEVAFSLDS